MSQQDPRSSSLPSASGAPLRSTFADDPEMRELVEMFVQEMPERIEAIRTAFDGAEMARLKTLSHQLKGASAGYGFAPLGEAAGKVEDAVRSAPDELSAIRARVDELLEVCRRVTFG
ncbi:MAG: Hpt domain-containing protein [Planctomycetota bacterium]|nr:Hpt domain-containing protein [Planctomycetota bacterium]